MRKIIFLWCILYTSNICLAQTTFLFDIKTNKDWDLLKGKPLSSKYGNVESIKLIYVLSNNTLYFANSKIYPFHQKFCENILNDQEELIDFNEHNYTQSIKRNYILANLNLYKSTNTYAIEFFPGDNVTYEQVATMYKHVQKHCNISPYVSVIKSNELAERFRTILNDSIKYISPDSIYKQQTMQCLQQGITFGKLRKVDIKEISKTAIQQEDIIITNGLPLDIPALAGIITTVFQTPLSHLSVLCNNRKTPNSSMKNIWNNAYVNSLVNQWVKYIVTADTIFIEKATQLEVEKNSTKKTLPIINLNINEKDSGLVYFKKTTFNKLIKLVGGKAANYGELSKINYSYLKKIPIPEAGFAIPFYYYVQHIQQYNINADIDSLLRIKPSNDKQLKKQLKHIREKIKNTKLNDNLIELVKNELALHPEYHYFRFRSSTNAEDIPNFNGAGLYQSCSASLSDSIKTIERAIKKVWASTWGEQAYKERAYFNINQKQIAMGILVHRAFGTELANGVAVTKNLYREDYPSFTLNIQKGEVSVVFPQEGVQAEQVLVSINGIYEGNIAIDYLTYSSLSKDKSILTQKQLEKLHEYLSAIKNHYYFNFYNNGKVSFNDFAMDVEFKLDSLTNTIYIKQARPFK